MPSLATGRPTPVESLPTMEPKRGSWYIAGIVLAVLAILGAAFQLLVLITGQSSTASKSYGGPVTNVVVSTDSGNVQIIADAKDETVVERTVSWSLVGGGSASADRLDNGILNLPGCSAGWNCEVSYVVHVQAGTDVKLNLDSGDASVAGKVGTVNVANDSGAVLVDGAQGAVRVVLDSGDVTLRNISAPVNASLDSGSINAEGLSGDKVSLTTSSGDVSAQFTVDPQSITALSDSGAIMLTVPGKTPYNAKVSVGSGTSKVDIPTDPTASRSLRVAVDSGDVEVTRNPS